MNQLQRSKEKSLTASIQDSNGTFTQSAQEINHIFCHFYKTFYSTTNNPNPEDIQAFLKNINLPQLTEEQSNLLDLPLTINELSSGLESMSAGKAPGSDGFPAKFFKHFWSMILQDSDID